MFPLGDLGELGKLDRWLRGSNAEDAAIAACMAGVRAGTEALSDLRTAEMMAGHCSSGGETTEM